MSEQRSGIYSMGGSKKLWALGPEIALGGHRRRSRNIEVGGVVGGGEEDKLSVGNGVGGAGEESNLISNASYHFY